MLRACNIQVDLGGVSVLENVTVALAPGEVVAVVGPNGAGKSTLLAVLSGALAARKGHASLEERQMADWTPLALARRRAVLPQHPQLAFTFSVFEVVLLGRAPHVGTCSREKDLSIAQESLAEAGVEHLSERPHTTLSGGERQRVQLARVLAQIEFPVVDEGGIGRYLLLDEPTTNLDLAHGHRILETARRASDRGIGVLAVLHDLNLASMYSDRIIALHDRGVLYEGRPAEVLTRERIHEVFDLSVRVVPHPTRDCPHVIAE